MASLLTFVENLVSFNLMSICEFWWFFKWLNIGDLCSGICVIVMGFDWWMNECMGGKMGGQNERKCVCVCVCGTEVVDSKYWESNLENLTLRFCRCVDV